ncbi:RHS repeat domain-containing protein [Pirellulaceae bacterium SH449]
MTHHPTITCEAPTSASLPFDASLDSIDSLPTSFTASVVPTLETTTVTEVALGYHRNQQYSITAMTTSTGAVAERYAYTAYGQPTILNASGTVLTSSAVGNRYTYTGREWDETLGLHHFRARWMRPLAGRFLGRDPIGYIAGISLCQNYFSNRGMDPSGLDFVVGSDDNGNTIFWSGQYCHVRAPNGGFQRIECPDIDGPNTGIDDLFDSWSLISILEAVRCPQKVGGLDSSNFITTYIQRYVSSLAEFRDGHCRQWYIDAINGISNAANGDCRGCNRIQTHVGAGSQSPTNADRCNERLLHSGSLSPHVTFAAFSNSISTACKAICDRCIEEDCAKRRK